MGDIAYCFHFQPSEIDKLSQGDLIRWHDQAIKIAKRQQQ
jgi:hypothetical protein